VSAQRFTLTAEHLELARRMYVEWDNCEYGAPAINPKRPYGNSDVEGDIAEILGWAWEDTDERAQAESERARAIHCEMETVLTILLGHAGRTVEPGDYVDHAGEYGRADWQREAWRS
jgi:hypothetical protein